MLTCGPCPIMDSNSFSTQSVVSAYLSDGLVILIDYPIILCLCLIRLGTRVLGIGANPYGPYVLLSYREDKGSLFYISQEIIPNSNLSVECS